MNVNKEMETNKNKPTKHGKGLLDSYFEDCGSNAEREQKMFCYGFIACGFVGAIGCALMVSLLGMYIIRGI